MSEQDDVDRMKKGSWWYI